MSPANILDSDRTLDLFPRFIGEIELVGGIKAEPATSGEERLDVDRSGLSGGGAVKVTGLMVACKSIVVLKSVRRSR